MKRNKKVNILLDKINEHISTNINLYLLISIIFLIGIIGGVLFANNIEDNIKDSTKIYFNEFVEIINNGYKIEYNNILKQTILNNVIYAIVIWFLGCTVIGMPLVYGIIAWKGFSLSYCISSIISSFGIGKGIVFCFISMFLQNIIIIPALIIIAVSGNRLHKSIIKNKKRENIKIEIVRHTLFSLFILVFLILSAFIETYISSNLIQMYVINIKSL